MVFPSSWISQSIASQNSMFGQMQQYAQMASYSAGTMGGGPPPQMMPPMAPPPPPTMMGMMRGYGGYAGGPTAGAWGEAMAGRLANAGHMGLGAAGIGLTGLGMASSMGLVGGGLGAMGALANPMGLAMSAGMGAFGAAGGGLGGLAAGGLAMGGIGLPIYAGIQYASGLGKNFYGGMQDQMSLNNTLRQNFNFMGGQGAFGRGFNQQQMGQIGSMIGGETRSNVFTSAGELNQVIAGGAQMGAFTGVRDVQEFSRKFKEMLTTLKTVQRELGGNLTEALEFVNASRQAGIFGGTSATRFASTIRTVSAATGFDQGQLIQLAANGASIARAVGGRGEQGAHGALRGISTVSQALQGGMISEAMLSEATGGRTGQDAMSTFVTDMMQQSGRFSRTAAGRYSIFGLSNSEGRGLDQGALMDFMSGDMGVGDLSRRAHRNVNRMGRAQAINREGLLRGALMEEGGMAGQLGMMRMMVGDRAMDQGDDMMSLVMQRRLHMSRPQAEIMTSLMRNQSGIAAREAQDAVGSTRESQLRTDIREHRSADAFMRHLEHEVQDSTGMLKARDLGRTFVTRISSLAEKMMNDVLGISSDQMTTEGQAAMSRLRQGRATASDLSAMGMTSRGFIGGAGAFNINSQGLMETGPSVGERLRARGMDTSRMRSFTDAAAALQTAQSADMGVLSNAGDLRALRGLNTDVAGTSSRLLQARLAAQGSGNADDVFRFMGGNGNATAAFMAQQGISNDARADGAGRLMGRGGGTITAGMVGRDALRLLGVGAASVGTGGLALLPGLAAFGGGMGNNFMRSEVLSSMRDPQADSLDFLARGGHLADRLRPQARGSELARWGFGRQRGGGGAQAEGMLSALQSVSREDLQELQGNSEFMQRVRAATSAGTPEERASAMQRLTAYVQGQSGGSKQFAAMGSIVSQMEENLSKHGRFGTEISAFSQNDAAMRAARQQVMEFANSMRTLGTAGQGRIGAAYRALGTYAARGERENVLAAQAGLHQQVLSASEGEYQRTVENMMNQASSIQDPAERERRMAEARSAALSMSHERAIDRDLRGQGRRGGRGAIETAIGEMTGYSTGSMEFTVGGRTVHGQRAQTMLQEALAGRGLGGVRGRHDVLQQFTRQMMDPQGMGLNTQQARTMEGILANAVQHRDARTGAFTDDDRRRISEFTGRGDIQDAMREAQTRRTAQALSSAAQRDPVGAKQIELLTTISDTLKTRLQAPEGGTTPATATPNS